MLSSAKEPWSSTPSSPNVLSIRVARRRHTNAGLNEAGCGTALWRVNKRQRESAVVRISVGRAEMAPTEAYSRVARG